MQGFVCKWCSWIRHFGRLWFGSLPGRKHKGLLKDWEKLIAREREREACRVHWTLATRDSPVFFFLSLSLSFFLSPFCFIYLQQHIKWNRIVISYMFIYLLVLHVNERRAVRLQIRMTHNVGEDKNSLFDERRTSWPLNPRVWITWSRSKQESPRVSKYMRQQQISHLWPTFSSTSKTISTHTHSSSGTQKPASCCYLYYRKKKLYLKKKEENRIMVCVIYLIIVDSSSCFIFYFKRKLVPRDTTRFCQALESCQMLRVISFSRHFL